MGRIESLWAVARGCLIAALGAGAAACGNGSGAAVTCTTPDCCDASEARGCAHPAVELGDLGRFTHVAALSDGRLAIATYDSTRTNLVVVVERPDGSERDVHVVDGWRRTADQGGARLVDIDAGRWATLAVGGDDALHVAWFDADEGELHYASGTAAGGFAQVEVVDGDGPATRGTDASLALDAAGEPHIAYRDATRRALRYAWRDARGQWQTRAIDGCAGEPGCPVAGSEDYGEWAALAFVPAVGGGVTPRIAFYDRFRGDLKVAAQGADGTWVTSTLDGRDPVTFADEGDVGRFASVDLTPNRQLGIAYFDATRGALRYLAPGAAPRTVDDGRWLTRAGGARRHAVGQYVRLRYDAAGRAHFVYADGSAPGLRHAVVLGEGAPVVMPLELAPGGWIDFVVAPPAGDDDQASLVGAYGAFVDGLAPRTRLALFTVTP